MATVRLTKGTYREVWQDVAPLEGGVTQTITTGIRANAVSLSRVFGILALQNIAGTPNISATTSVVDGYLVVTLANTAAPGNAAAWQLNVVLTHSMQQNVDPVGPSGIYVINPGSTSVGSDLVVDSIAELRNWEGSLTLKTATTRGYYTAADGGGNTFSWSAASVATDNGGNRIKPTATVGAGRWLAAPATTFNVLQFGVKMDTLVDNSTSYQNTIDAAKVAGGEIVFPSGVCYFTSVEFSDAEAISIKGAQSEYGGAGKGTQFRSFAPSAYMVRFVGNTVNIQHCGIDFDGQSQATDVILFDSVSGKSITYIKFPRCNFRNVKDGGTFVRNYATAANAGECSLVDFSDHTNMYLSSDVDLTAKGTAILLRNHGAWLWTLRNAYISGIPGTFGHVCLDCGEMLIDRVGFDNGSEPDVTTTDAAHLIISNSISGTNGPLVKVAPADPLIVPYKFANLGVVVENTVQFATGVPPATSILDTTGAPLSIKNLRGHGGIITYAGNKVINIANAGVWLLNGQSTNTVSVFVSQDVTDTVDIQRFYASDLASYLGIAHNASERHFGETLNLNAYKPGVGYLPLYLAGSHVLMPPIPLLAAAVAALPAPQPAAPPAGWGQQFYRVNISGKIEFCVQFPTGAVQVLSTEP